jgi:hypothetical protein
VAEQQGSSKTHDSFFPKIKTTFKDRVQSLPDETIPTVTNIRLEDGITMSSINKNNSKMKILFHVPHFDLYIIKVTFSNNNLGNTHELECFYFTF